MGESITKPFYPSFDESLASISKDGIFSRTIMVDKYSLVEKEIIGSILDYYLEPQEEGGFVAFSREFPGAVGQGETVEEAIADLNEAIQLLKEVLEEDKASQNK